MSGNKREYTYFLLVINCKDLLSRKIKHYQALKALICQVTELLQKVYLYSNFTIWNLIPNDFSDKARLKALNKSAGIKRSLRMWRK